MPKTVKASTTPPSKSNAHDGASSVGRVFEVLDLFTLEQPTLRVDDVSALLGYTRSTSYRYVKALADAGLVAPIGGGYYALGSRAVELDRLLQLTDPLLHAGQAVMPTLVDKASDAALLLCSLYSDKVLCIHHEGPLALEHRGRMVSISRPRGMPFSLFSGAASLVILAHLAPHRIKSIYLRHQLGIAQTGFAADWQTFRALLARIRADGYAYSTGTFNHQLAGLAVAAITDDGEVLGSLTQVQSRDRVVEEQRPNVAERLREAAGRIASTVAKSRSIKR